MHAFWCFSLIDKRIFAVFYNRVDNFCRLRTMHERDRQTKSQTDNGTLASNEIGVIACQRCRLKAEESGVSNSDVQMWTFAEVLSGELSVAVLILIIAPAMMLCVTILICLLILLVHYCKKCCRRRRRKCEDVMVYLFTTTVNRDKCKKHSLSHQLTAQLHIENSKNKKWW